jgi:uncharacterized membrane protein YqhA
MDHVILPVVQYIVTTSSIHFLNRVLHIPEITRLYGTVRFSLIDPQEVHKLFGSNSMITWYTRDEEARRIGSTPK